MKLIKIFILILFSPLLTIGQRNLSKFHHKIKKDKVESGYLPLIYTYNSIDYKLYGPDRNDSIKICSDFKGIVSQSSDGNPNVDIYSYNNLGMSDIKCIGKHTKLGQFKLDLKRDSLGDPTYSVKIPFKLKTWTIATVPFRYRFKTDSSSSTVTSNLSASVGYNWSIVGHSKVTHRQISHYYILAGPFIGVSSADLKKSTVKNPSTWTTDRTNFALSYGASLTFARNNLGFVISVGIDHALGDYSKQWSYQNKPWIGIGVNTSLGIF